MARKARRIQILQDSPFLNLPVEIREQIYHDALVRPTPIDLWSLKYIQDPSSIRVFRLQEDLQFVRKEMATGLLTTCKQVYHEAGILFWSKNTFRFSGDIEWFGARRFLGQIGPRALSQLQSLELFAPLAEARCLHTGSFDNGDRIERIKFYTNAREAKNRPKMHMVKARKELWTWDGLTWFEDINTPFALTRNVEHVCYLFDAAKASLELKLILPRGFGLTEVHPNPWSRTAPWGWGRRSRRNRVQNNLQIPEELLRIIPRFPKTVTLIIEAGAYLCSQDIQEFADKGINVLCQPHSLFQPDPSQQATAILETKQWTDPGLKFDYLVGVSALFSEVQEVSVPALGGRATATPGPKNTARILRGFGGCRFIEQDE